MQVQVQCKYSQNKAKPLPAGEVVQQESPLNGFLGLSTAGGTSLPGNLRQQNGREPQPGMTQSQLTAEAMLKWRGVKSCYLAA